MKKIYLGRLHVPCQEQCTKILVCGHKCESKCYQICPPCKKNCDPPVCEHQLLKDDTKNESLVDKVLCSDPCSPCTKSCQNSCEHQKCEKSCWEECDVKPCLEFCKKELKCSPKKKKNKRKERHSCMGVCGEICLENLCKHCNSQKYREVKEMNDVNDDKNARFVHLNECGHYIEVKVISFTLPYFL